MCVGNETLYACGHMVVVLMVVYVGEITKCPCLETFHAETGDKCRHCIARDQNSKLRATDLSATEIEEKNKVGGKHRGQEKIKRLEEDEYEYQFICGECRRDGCGKCGECVCCKEGKKGNEVEDGGVSN